MQNSVDLVCTECSDKFDSASLLLQHFANHAITHLESEITSLRFDLHEKKNKIPNLYPINALCDTNFNETDRGSDSGIEDVNPLKFCVVTMEEKQKLQCKVDQEQPEHKDNEISITPKKYQCMYCLKRFGWSTDLKRHILIHTGERPFQCPDCNSSFTRNFLLQKHQKKVHISGRVVEKLPELRPISEVLNKKRRKQHKFLIKRNMTLDESTNAYFDHKMNRLLCSS